MEEDKMTNVMRDLIANAKWRRRLEETKTWSDVEKTVIEFCEEKIKLAHKLEHYKVKMK